MTGPNGRKGNCAGVHTGAKKGNLRASPAKPGQDNAGDIAVCDPGQNLPLKSKHRSASLTARCDEPDLFEMSGSGERTRQVAWLVEKVTSP
jgi:hypothetical protein